MRQRKIDYTVRESLRAKRVILKVGVNGLEVVVPRRLVSGGCRGFLRTTASGLRKNCNESRNALLSSPLSASI